MASARVTVSLHGFDEARALSRRVRELLWPGGARLGACGQMQTNSDPPRLRCYMCSMFAEDHPTTVCHKFVPPER